MHQKQMDQQINSTRFATNSGTYCCKCINKSEMYQRISTGWINSRWINSTWIKLMNHKGQVDRSAVDRSTAGRLDQQKFDLCQIQQEPTRQKHIDQVADYGSQAD